MPSNIKNTADLRAMLLDVISDVRAQRIEAGDAKAISSLASQILTSAKLDLDVMKAAVGENGKHISSTLLTYADNLERSPFEGMTDEEYRQIISMRKDNKKLPVVCDAFRDKDKRLIAAAYYGKHLEE